jgi:hypothetical protein
MTRDQLVQVMLYQLRSLGTQPSPTEESIHSDCLESDDSLSPGGSAAKYRDVVTWTLDRQGYKQVPWPADWMSMSVGALADALLKGGT